MALFDKSKTVNTAKPKAAKRDDTVTIPVAKLASLAAIDKVMKTLKTLKETVEKEVKADAMNVFISQGRQLGKRPENFKGKDGLAEASIQLKASSSTQVLSEDVQKRLAEVNVPVKEVDTVVETFVLNPAYMADADLMAKVEAALDGIVPEDFFLHQSQKKVICDGNNTIDAIMKL